MIRAIEIDRSLEGLSRIHQATGLCVRNAKMVINLGAVWGQATGGFQVPNGLLSLAPIQCMGPLRIEASRPYALATRHADHEDQPQQGLGQKAAGFDQAG